MTEQEIESFKRLFWRYIEEKLSQIPWMRELGIQIMNDFVNWLDE